MIDFRKLLTKCDYNEFKVKYKKITECDLNKMIGKHIHLSFFDEYDNNRNIIMPAKVLNYNNNNLLVLPYDLLYELEEDTKYLEKEIKIKNIKGVYVFNVYNNEYYELSNNLPLDKNNKANTFILELENIWENTIEAIIASYDGFSFKFIYKNLNEKICIGEYPFYFLNNIKIKYYLK